MSPNNSFQNTDKFEIHYRQQLSALIDGELPADESRFLLRRLERDEELIGCQERWQLCGDVLRGAACAPAPQDFAAKVGAALAAEPAPALAPERRAGSGWRWGGGAALAASVAAIALFMARERVAGPDQLDAAPMTVVATTAEMPSPRPAPVDPAPQLEAAIAAVPAAALASARRQDASQRRGGSATRNQQVARSVAARQQEPQRQVAAAGLPAVEPAAADPFAHPSSLQAKPWPRAVLSGAGDSALNASFSAGDRPATFYPFEPRLPAAATAPEAVRPPLQ